MKERYDIEHVDHDEEDRKPRCDETRLYQTEIDGRRDTRFTDVEPYKDDTELREYPKEEIGLRKTEEDDMPGEIYRKLWEKPRITEVATTQKVVEDISKSYKDDICDTDSIREFEKRPIESKRVEQSIVRTEKLTKPQKVCFTKEFMKRSVHWGTLRHSTLS